VEPIAVAVRLAGVAVTMRGKTVGDAAKCACKELNGDMKLLEAMEGAVAA
jgi:hypothetical protein